MMVTRTVLCFVSNLLPSLLSCSQRPAGRPAWRPKEKVDFISASHHSVTAKVLEQERHVKAVLNQKPHLLSGRAGETRISLYNRHFINIQVSLWICCRTKSRTLSERAHLGSRCAARSWRSDWSNGSTGSLKKWAACRENNEAGTFLVTRLCVKNLQGILAFRQSLCLL